MIEQTEYTEGKIMAHLIDNTYVESDLFSDEELEKIRSDDMKEEFEEILGQGDHGHVTFKYEDGWKIIPKDKILMLELKLGPEPF